MNLKDCVARAVKANAMDPERAKRVVADYERLLPEFKRTMGPTAAELEAANAVMKAVRREAFEKRRRTQLQAAATRRLAERMVTHRDTLGRLNPSRFIIDLVGSRRGIGGATLQGKFNAVRRRFRSEMTDAIVAFRANLVGGRRNKAMLNDVVGELFGRDTKNAKARALASAWSKVAETARLRFNAAGGHIGKLDGWGLPQFHDTRAVRKVGYETWRDSILPRLDLEKMEDPRTGLSFTPETIEARLKDAFEAIRTDGYSRVKASARFGSAKYNSRSDPRFFKFKSPEDWLAYSAEFGGGVDPFRVMMGHLDSMAMDIAMMEELGPNPDVTFAWLGEASKKLAAQSDDPKALDKAASRVGTANEAYDVLTGRANAPHSRGFARGAAAVRNYLTSTHLGSAVLSSVTDFNTSRLAAGYAGLAKTGPVRQLAKLMASPELREVANEAGLVFENAVDVGNAAARFELEEMHVETAARMADFTIRASGLGYLTEVQRQAFGLEFMKSAAGWAGTSWGGLDKRARDVLTRYGFTQEMWGAVNKATPHQTERGLTLLRPQDVEAAAGQRTADLYLEMVANLTDYAVPTTDLIGRATVLGKTRPGSISGEFVRFGLQFKAFPITIMMQQFGRIAEAATGASSRSAAVKGVVGYGSGLLLGNTLLGALAVQLKEASKGRDPRDMTEGRFWAAAMLQGGGVGIFGDFLFSDQNRFGGSFGETLAGPGAGAFDDIVLKFGVGNVQELAAGEDTKAGKEFVGLLRRYTPGGSLWYLRMAYEREILDRLERAVNPEADKTFRRRVKFAERQGAQYFFAPGQSVLDRRGPRAPELARVIGG
jgi:hypothetical protein